MPLQLRRGTDAQRSGVVFAAGELIYVTDTEALYVGDGSTVGGVAVANLSAADIRSISAGVLTGGSHTGITFTYDGTNIDAVVDPDLSNYQGVIRASAFNGTLVDDSSTVLVDAVDSKINLDGTVKGNIIPDADQAYDIGSSSFKFRDLYLSGSSLYLGSAQVTAVGSAINLPAGSTVNGVLIGSGSGTGDGVIEGSTYKINIAADDSSLMVNTDTEEITASGGFIGDLQGNVTGDVQGNLTGNVQGNVTGDLTGDVFGDVEGSFYGFGPTLLVDGGLNKIVGEVDTTIANVGIYTGNTIVLSGSTPGGVKAGLKIATDGNANDSYDLLTLEGAKEDATGMSVVYSRARGTPGTPAPLQDGDEILGQFWFGADSDSVPQLSSAILASVEGTPSSGIVPGYLTFATANAGGVITPALTIDSSQVIGVAANTLTAGGGSGQVNTGSVATYLKINIGGTDYAIPAYAINP
jgi:Major tropism determinant N-terminal domain